MEEGVGLRGLVEILRGSRSWKMEVQICSSIQSSRKYVINEKNKKIFLKDIEYTITS
jgi:hypothetical protein